MNSDWVSPGRMVWPSYANEMKPKCHHKSSPTKMDSPHSHRHQAEGKENQAPLKEAGSDDEVFFGSITEKERSKMRKMKRKTLVYVANFRAEVRRSTDEMLADTAYNSHGSVDRESLNISMTTSPLQSSRESGQKVDAALMSSPVVIVPSHKPGVKEISPQHNASLLPMMESSELVHKCSNDEQDMATIAFNATDDKVTSESIHLSDPSLIHKCFHSPSQMLPSDPEILHSKSLSKCVTSGTKLHSKKKNCPPPKVDFSESFLNPSVHGKEYSESSSYTCNYLGVHQTDQISRHIDQTECSIVSTDAIVPGLQDISHKPIRHVQESHTDVISSLVNISLQQIQSPVFSSPCLFPVTVQAVQSQQSIPSTVLFSPITFSENKQDEDINHSANVSHLSPKTQQLKSLSTPKSVEEVKDQQAWNGSAMITSPLITDLCHSHIASHKCGTINDTSVSQNVSIKMPDQYMYTAKATPQSGGDPLITHTCIITSKTECQAGFEISPEIDDNVKHPDSLTEDFPSPGTMLKRPHERLCSDNATLSEIQSIGLHSVAVSSNMEKRSQGVRCKLELIKQKKEELARIRAQKAELQHTLKTEHEMCLMMKQGVQSALRSNTCHANIPLHLLSLGCQGVSSLTLTEQELDLVTRLHTIRNSHHEISPNVMASSRQAAQHREHLHLTWHSTLVTEVHQLSSPSHHCKVHVARPILSKRVSNWK